MGYLFYILVAYGSALLSAGIAISAKILTGSIPPLLLTLLRFSISTSCLIPFVQWKEFRKLTYKAAVSILFLGFIGIFFANYLYLTGISQSTAINAAIIMALIPILVLFLYSIIHRKLPKFQQLASFALSLLGVILIISKGNIANVTASSGDLYLFGAALCWASYGIVVKTITDKVSTFFITFAANFVSLFFGLITCNVSEFYTIIPELTTTHWLLLLYMGSLGTALNYFLYAEAMNHLGPPTAAFIIYGNTPIFVTILSYLLLGEVLLLTQFIGMLMVLYALYLNYGGNTIIKETHQN
jgi:drug/metabolite transporter (DMT)-like permease